jgi:hypothetical protein
MNETSHSLGEDYIRLSYQVDQLLKEKFGEETIIVDSYFGPDFGGLSIEKIDPDVLYGKIHNLRSQVKKYHLAEPLRTFLKKQLDALALLVRLALDEEISFETRVKIGLDVDVVVVKNERIEELAEETARELKQRVRSGTLTSMATQWQKRSLIKGDEVLQFALEAAQSARASTQRLLFKLPESEGVEFRAVPDAPWYAYNHYKGNFQALIEVNVKLPQSKYNVWNFVTHETYPGHQTQLVAREVAYQKGLLPAEGTIAIINTPDCTVAEGLACAGTTILSKDRPLSEEEMVNAQLGKLRQAVGINALIMLQRDGRSESEVLEYLMDQGALEENYAKARLPFMTDIMFGPYGFTYFVGGWLIREFYNAAVEANILNEFIQTIYHELHTPSTIKMRLNQLDLKIPPLFN